MIALTKSALGLRKQEQRMIQTLSSRQTKPESEARNVATIEDLGEPAFQGRKDQVVLRELLEYEEAVVPTVLVGKVGHCPLYECADRRVVELRDLRQQEAAQERMDDVAFSSEEAALGRLCNPLHVRHAEQRTRAAYSRQGQEEHRLAQLRRCAGEQILGEEAVQLLRREAGCHLRATAHRGEPDHRRPAAGLRDDALALSPEHLQRLVVRE